MGNEYFDSTLKNQQVPIIQVGRVTNIVDKTKSGTIEVSITGMDTNNNKNNEIIPCIPLLPKYFSLLPKENDLVFVIQSKFIHGPPGTESNTTRYWVGPLIPQNKDLAGVEYDTAQNILPFGYRKNDADDSEEGAYGNPEDGDIILQGKDNTDIIQKSREIWIRAGKNEIQESEDGKSTKIFLNKIDPGYIQLKYGKDLLKQDVEEFTQTIYIPQKPDVIFKVNINTYELDGEKLDGNLPPSYYIGDNILKTEIFITLYNYKDNKVIDKYINQTDYTGSNSRKNALKEAKRWIDDRKGKKWLIKSRDADLINIYKGNNGTAIASMEPIKKETTIQKNTFKKGKDEKNSVINFVANKINLLSHNGEHTFDMTNPKNLISDTEQKEINKKAHPLVYGDTLVEFLELVKKYVSLHVHPYHGLPADPGQVTTDVLNFNLETILNKNIRSN